MVDMVKLFQDLELVARVEGFDDVVPVLVIDDIQDKAGVKVGAPGGINPKGHTRLGQIIKMTCVAGAGGRPLTTNGVGFALELGEFSLVVMVHHDIQGFGC